MPSLTLTRIFAYTLMQGIERSLGKAIEESLDMDTTALFSRDESDRALGRLREDMDDDQWTLDHVAPGDLLPYLDMGDLVAVLARNAAVTRNVMRKHVTQAATIINQSGLLTIRKRVMHPIRPMEPDDCSCIREAGQELLDKCPSLTWSPLKEAFQTVAEGKLPPRFAIPTFWIEKSPVAHNLPAAEFADTGFIGRAEERRKIAQLLKSTHSVITIVGEGGAGKTALALRTCFDILDDPDPQFDRLIWVSLKTRHLTPAGIQEIAAAVDSVEGLIAAVSAEAGVSKAAPATDPWLPIVEGLGSIRTLLVIDNLETIGDVIRDFLIQVPVYSKVLLTSRIGLGEIEIRHQLADYPLRDAVRLFKGVASVSGYQQVLRTGQKAIEKYCQRLGSNPLLVKWFVHAVGRGADPDVLHPKAGGASEALDFCFENVYERLIADAKLVLSVLMAARQSLTRTQIQELTRLEFVECERAYLDLVRSSMVDFTVDGNGARTTYIPVLVADYLSRHYPPANDLVHRVRVTISAWKAERDRAAVEVQTYRYDRFTFQIATPDQSIAARYLRQALDAARAGDHDGASKAWQRADGLLPAWFEVPRVKALLLALRHGPLFEVEGAFETSIACQDHDTNRYHYAVYLMREAEFDRSLTQIEAALNHDEAIGPILTGLRGLVLMRMGKYNEAELDLRGSFEGAPDRTPLNVRLSQATQLLDCLRRRAEQSLNIGLRAEAIADLATAALTCTDAMDAFGVDKYIAEAAVRILCEADRAGVDVRATPPFEALTSRDWQDPDFVAAAAANPKVLRTLTYFPDLQVALPTLAACLSLEPAPNATDRTTGRIERLWPDRFFGFIRTEDGTDVHFGRDSLIDPFSWNELSENDVVEFSVAAVSRGPHAVGMDKARAAQPR